MSILNWSDTASSKICLLGRFVQLFTNLTKIQFYALDSTVESVGTVFMVISIFSLCDFFWVFPLETLDVDLGGGVKDNMFDIDKHVQLKITNQISKANPSGNWAKGASNINDVLQNIKHELVTTILFVVLRFLRVSTEAWYSGCRSYSFNVEVSSSLALSHS